jgi:Xaa-Pro aminopeptidase
MAQNGDTPPTTARLNDLRALMRHKQVDIYGIPSSLSLIKVVPSEDAHQSEYVCAADKRREFISGRLP